MITLRMLGRLALDGLDASFSGRLTQRRRLAVLALMATAPGRTMSRDRLLLLIWPDADTRSARHSLASVLYDLRQAIGADAIVTRGEDVWLDPSHVATDVDVFEEAIATGEWERAAALYDGPFLDGFHITDSAEFARHVDEQRTRLAHALVSAMATGARVCMQQGDPTRAAMLLRRAAAADPYDAPVAAALMRALAAAGDIAGALRHAVVHSAFVRTELDSDPDPEIERLVGELRAGSMTADGAQSGSVATRQDDDSAARPAATVEHTEPVEPAAGNAGPGELQLQFARARGIYAPLPAEWLRNRLRTLRRRIRNVMLATAIAGVAVSLGAGGSVEDSAAAAPTILPDRVIVPGEFASLVEPSIYDLVYLGPAHLRCAGIHEMAGDTARAIEHYAAFIGLWRDAEPSMHARVRLAEERLARLTAPQH